MTVLPTMWKKILRELNFFFVNFRQRLEQLVQRRESQTHLSRDMKRAAFRVLSALAATDEEIRKKIISTEDLMVMNHLNESLQESNDVNLQMAAVGCLHSFSRSVQHLRTTFQDHSVWKPLISILESPNPNVDCMVVASSTLCNLLLEFSPSKEPIGKNCDTFSHIKIVSWKNIWP